MLKGIQKILAEHGIEVPKPYIEVMSKGRPLHAYPDYVCLAVLEYFAFEQPNKIALQNFRKLAGKTLHDFIYTQVGYDPHHHVPEVWRQFHDRVSLVYNAVPAGYFCIFKEMSDIMVYLGQNGLQITNKFVPDISVGRLWADYWTKNRLAETFGERRIYKHNYPDYFPQALSNPQDASCYPEASLGEFRKWMRERYIGGGAFERYLEGQVEKLGLPPSFPQLAVSAFRDKQLE